MRSQKRHALIGFSFIEDEQPYNHGLLHGIFVDLLAPFLQSFDRSELIYLRLISSWGYHLITRTFWNWFQLISVKVHHSQVTLWAGRGHYWPPSCSMFWFLALFFLIEAHLSPSLKTKKSWREIMERKWSICQLREFMLTSCYVTFWIWGERREEEAQFEFRIVFVVTPLFLCLEFIYQFFDYVFLFMILDDNSRWSQCQLHIHKYTCDLWLCPYVI